MPPSNSSYLSNIQPFSLEPWLWEKIKIPKQRKTCFQSTMLASVPQVQGAVPLCSPHQCLYVFGFFDLGWMVWIHKPQTNIGVPYFPLNPGCFIPIVAYNQGFLVAHMKIPATLPGIFFVGTVILLKGWPSKIELTWVPGGIYIYIHIIYVWNIYIYM